MQYFRVLDEHLPNQCLFEAEIAANEIVNLQNGIISSMWLLPGFVDTVLGWKPRDGRDMAISFEYATCLTDVW